MFWLVITPFNGDSLPRFVSEQLTGVQRGLKAALTIPIVAKSNDIFMNYAFAMAMDIEIPSISLSFHVQKHLHVMPPRHCLSQQRELLPFVDRSTWRVGHDPSRASAIDVWTPRARNQRPRAGKLGTYAEVDGSINMDYHHLCLSIWLVVWNIFYFSIYWEYQLTNMFKRG